MATTVQTILKQAKANRQLVGFTLGANTSFGKGFSAQVESVGPTHVALTVMQ
jgi:hypothetical protein